MSNLTRRLSLIPSTTINGARKLSVSSQVLQQNDGDFFTSAARPKPYISIDGVTDTPPKSAKVVICGGGVVGTAVAYHLAKAGWGNDIILLDQGCIGAGSSWYATSGIVNLWKSTPSQIRFNRRSIKMLQDLTEKGHPTGWKQCGSLNLARNRDRMTAFRHIKSQSVAHQIDCKLVTPEECRALCPLLTDVKEIQGGLWIPEEGTADTRMVTRSLAEEAIRQGATMVEHCVIKAVHQRGGKVNAVETDRGTIECTYFVNCAGFWARRVGQLSEPHVKVPLHAVASHVLVAKLKELPGEMPVIRDLDGSVYVREGHNRILAGGYEKKAKPVYHKDAFPSSPEERHLPVDWDHFHELLEAILRCVPSLESATFERLSNSPEAYSPDGKWIVGESPEIRNYYVAAGVKTKGISAAGGVSRAIAECITQGYSPLDFHALDISRFLGLHNNRKFLRDRVKEVPSQQYATQYPFYEYEYGRNVRMSPIFPSLKAAGAVFGQTMGYERPFFFDPDNTLGEEGLPRFRIALTRTFGKPAYFDLAAAEYERCREKIGLCDYSSFTKIDLWSSGREVVDFLQYLCSNDVDVPVGSIIHTGMQNIHGGYENDCSFARLSEHHYMMIAPTTQQTRCKTWIQRHLPKDGSVSVSDVTSMYTAICIMGPFTRTMLSELTDQDLSPKHFPFFTCRELDVGLANGIRALNLTHTGELGYVLYIPNEFALHVYTRLLEAGQKYGIGLCGYYAMRALRVEKFYAFWGQDLDTFTTPLECGRSWRVKFKKNIDFLGKDALLKQREEGVKRMYIQLVLNDHDPDVDVWCISGEPIYRNGINVGQTTTTSYGFTFKTQVCLGFVKNIDEQGNELRVTNDYVLNGDYEVEVAGIRYPAKINLHSPNLPTKYPDQEREAYQATRDKMDQMALLTYNS